MNKSVLSTFIRKYHLGGTTPVESVIWKVKDKQLSTRFMTDDQSVLGEVTLKSMDFEDVEFGIYVTSQLKKMLDVMLLEVDISLEKKGDKLTSIQFSDGQAKVNFMLAEMTIIPKVPSMKEMPEFTISIPMGKDLIDRFIKAKAALSDIETFTFMAEGGQAKIIIGYSSTINSNRISMDVDCDCGDVEPISFNADYFREILIANRETDSATLEVSTQGLAKVTFDINDFVSEYYLVQLASGS